MKPIKCWHFLSSDKRLRWGTKEIVEVGKTYTATGDIEMCKNGLHGSKRILDALRYAPGFICCRVEIWGEVIQGDDKLVGRHRKVLQMIDATDILRKFARMCALDVVNLWDAPDVVIKYLKTGDESIRVGAWDAAWYAARIAAGYAAGYAARAAARDTAWYAARVAARYAVRDDARDIERVAARYAVKGDARDEERNDARDAVWYAARVAARDTAWYAERVAARCAVRDATWHDTWDAARAAAWDAARVDAWDAARAATGGDSWGSTDKKQNTRLTRMIKKAMEANK